MPIHRSAKLLSFGAAAVIAGTVVPVLAASAPSEDARKASAPTAHSDATIRDSVKAVLSTGSPLVPEGYDYVYERVKSDVQLASISGGTDIISCFALGNPVGPVWRGELQTRGLGMRVEILEPAGDEAAPGDPGNGMYIEELGREVPVDIAYAGSCTAGKKEDMDMYARVFQEALERGEKVRVRVKAWTSRNSYEGAGVKHQSMALWRPGLASANADTIANN